ncbi:ATPase [Rhodobacteraceae bacterium CCMM004]|nr:ATPase [Rhodobacteraceae bacterium CCMM004]
MSRVAPVTGGKPRDRAHRPLVRRVVLTGASGGGKSTLLAALAGRGIATVAEPGRRVIAAGLATPWDDPGGFARACVETALADLEGATAPVAVFDRSALDALAHGARIGAALPAVDPRGLYDTDVLFAPLWPEIFATDADRRHDLAAAAAEADDLARRLPTWGYRLHVLPKVTVAARADWALARLGLTEEVAP